MKELYICFERGVHGGHEIFGLFEKDEEALQKFRQELKDDFYAECREWFIGKLDRNGIGIQSTLPCIELEIYKNEP